MKERGHIELRLAGEVGRRLQSVRYRTVDTERDLALVPAHLVTGDPALALPLQDDTALVLPLPDDIALAFPLQGDITPDRHTTMVTGDQDHETAVHWPSKYSGGVVVRRSYEQGPLVWVVPSVEHTPTHYPESQVHTQYVPTVPPTTAVPHEAPTVRLQDI